MGPFRAGAIWVRFPGSNRVALRGKSPFNFPVRNFPQGRQVEDDHDSKTKMTVRRLKWREYLLLLDLLLLAGNRSPIVLVLRIFPKANPAKALRIIK
jgi:hypothetical protein